MRIVPTNTWVYHVFGVISVTWPWISYLWPTRFISIYIFTGKSLQPPAHSRYNNHAFENKNRNGMILINYLYMHWECVLLTRMAVNEMCNGTILTYLRPEQNGKHFEDDILKCMFLKENIWIKAKFHWNMYFWYDWQLIIIGSGCGLAPDLRQATFTEGSFCVCAQPMRNDVTMQRRLSLAGRILKRIPAFPDTNVTKFHDAMWCHTGLKELKLIVLVNISGEVRRIPCW